MKDKNDLKSYRLGRSVFCESKLAYAIANGCKQYLVNEKEAEAFDREFPYMEKKKLPGQIFFYLANFIKSLFFPDRLYFSKK